MSTFKVGIVGHFSEYSTETQLHWTLQERLGIPTLKIDENADDIISQGLQCDLLILVGSHGRFLDFSPLRQKGIVIVLFHLDIYKGIPDREAVIGKSWHWQTDLQFLGDMGMSYLPTFKYMAPAVAECYAHYGIPREDMRCDVAFFGSKGYHKEWPWRVKLLDWLETVYGESFIHYDAEHKVFGHDLCDAVSSAKVIIADHIFADGKHSHGWSDRYPEIMGRGGVLLCPRTKGLVVPEALTYEPMDLYSLQRRIDYVLTLSEDERLSYAAFFHERTVKNDTYTARMKQLLKEVQCLKK